MFFDTRIILRSRHNRSYSPGPPYQGLLLPARDNSKKPSILRNPTRSSQGTTRQYPLGLETDWKNHLNGLNEATPTDEGAPRTARTSRTRCCLAIPCYRLTSFDCMENSSSSKEPSRHKWVTKMTASISLPFSNPVTAVIRKLLATARQNKPRS